MERLSFGIQQGRARKANTMATEEHLAKLHAGGLLWAVESEENQSGDNRALVAALVQNIARTLRTRG